MNTIELLEHLRKLDIKLWAEGDQLKFSAPKGVMTPSLREQVIRLKAELLELVRFSQTPSSTMLLSIEPVSREQAIPVSFAQQRFWFLDRYETERSSFNISGPIRLVGKLHREALEQSIQKMIDRHESFRTTFQEHEGHVVQVIAPTLKFSFPVIDLANAPTALRDQQVRDLARQEAATFFDLSQGPLLRTLLIRLGEQEHILIVTVHHIIFDGWSFGIFMGEVSVLYTAYVTGQSVSLPAVSLQYADFAVWQRKRMQENVLQEQLAFWVKLLSGVQPLDLPTDHPRPSILSQEARHYQFQIPASLVQNLKVLCRHYDTTLFVLLLTTFQILLARHSGQDDICIGSPIANRTRADLEGVIGCFINTLAFRTPIPQDATFLQVLQYNRKLAIDAYAHQDVPFEKIVEEVQPERSLSRSPLIQVMFSLENMPMAPLMLDGIQTQLVDADRQSSQFELVLTLEETEEGMSGVLSYSTDLFEEDTITRLAEHLQVLLQAILERPEQRVQELPLLSERERVQVLSDWNDAARAAIAPACIHELFAQQAQRTPDALALVCGEQQLSYGELERRANQLAWWLQRQGVGPEGLVGLCVERSLEMVIGVLGILKAGGAYVPLDPAYPQERLAFMIQDAQLRLLLTQQHLQAHVPAGRVPVISLESAWPDIAQESVTVPQTSVIPENLAYVIYTSGSTGRPKGTLVPHRGFASLAHWLRQTFYLQTPQRVLQCASFSFDASVWEMVAALLSGGMLHLPAPDLRMIGTDLLDLLVERAIENVIVTPSALTTVPLAPLPDLRTLVVGGEACPVELMRFWAQDRAFLNAYGPTEATIGASAARCEASQERILIGRPVTNTRLYVLDPHLQPMPIGVPGELYIGGMGVSRGYLGRPELTAERFLADPFGPQEGGRLYRTGDLVRSLPDGNLEFVGRIDQQVKIRGYRIELGEIENALRQHAAIQEAVVVVHQEGASKRLVAYVTPRESSSDLEEEQVRAFLLERLPAYMVPGSFVLLEHLPRTPSGKLDQQALRAVAGQQSVPARTYVAPRTPVEAQLAHIWQEVLGLSQSVGVHENFFALGGDSVLSLQIIFRAKEQGLHFTVKQIFQHQTIAQLSSVVREQIAIEVQAEQGIVSGPSVLTPIQRWFFAQSFAQPQHWNQAMLLRVPRQVTAGQWEQALGVLLRQHDGLRARFVQQEQDWQAHLVGWPVRVPLQVVELANWPQQERAGVVRAHSQEAQASLRLEEAPLVRAVLFVGLEEQANRLLLLAHHLVIDAVSWRILLEDLARLVEHLQQGQEPHLPAKTSAWPTWTKRLQEYGRQPHIQEELAYWQEQVRATAALPLDGVGGLNTVAEARSQEVQLSVQETQALLHEVPAAFNTQINDVLLTAVACALGWWIGSEQVRLDLEGHGREELFEDLDLSRTVGWFTTIAPLRLPVPEPSELGEGLKRIKEALRRRPRRGIGYGLLRYGQEVPIPALEQAPQAQVSFNYLGQFDQTFAGSFAAASEAIGPDWSPENQRMYLLDITSRIQDGVLQMQWTHHEQFHQPETIQQVAQQSLAVLRALIAESQRPDLNGYSPSDLPASGLEQGALDQLITELRRLPIWQAQDHPRPLEDVYPQTPAQQGLWFQSRYAQGQGFYHVQLVLEIAQDLQVEAFQQSWQQVMQRHPSLRTSFWELPGQEALQLVWSAVPLPLSVQDWRGQSRSQQHERLQDYLREERACGFAPQEVPQWRVLLAHTDFQEYQLVWSAHHSILDGWSMSIVLAEVSRCYSALSRGESVEWKPVRPYRDYLSWLRAQDLGQAEHYWRESLRGVEPASPLSVERRAGSDRHGTFEGQTHAKASLVLSEQETAQLQGLVQRYHLTLNTLLQGSWALVLSRYQGTDEALFGVVVSGRPAELEGVEQMVGLFINTLPLRVRVPGQMRWDEWIQQVQEQNVQMRHYEYSPLAQVQQWSGIPAGAPLFESLFVFENYPVEEEQLNALHLRAPRGEERIHYPLSIIMGLEKQLSVSISYDVRRFERETVERLLGHLQQVCAQIVQAPETRLAHLSLLTEQERVQVLSDWNAVDRAAIAPACIHELFAQQALRTPDALALVCDEQQLSYGELERRANQLARWLQRQGVGPEGLVGLCVERSLEMVIGVLGILKAGGAYVPLDPAYPQERLAFMIQDAQLRLLLTQQHLQARVPAGSVPLVCLDRGWPDIAQESVTAPLTSVTPENLAYVIYTSGSTGKPKGVLVPHRGIRSLTQWQIQNASLSQPRRVLQGTSINFDVSVWEIASALLSGGTLYLPSPDLRLIGTDLFDLLVEQAIESIAITPSALTTLPQAPLPNLQTLVVAGEACPVELMRFWAQEHDFFDAYGPTEATVYASVARCEASQEGIHIGRPLPHARLYVLDRYLQPVPIGVPGELYIGGIGVTRGYLGRPDLTAERFLADPFGPQEGGRLYRTGDLVRYLPDGNLEFLGRIDQQVKIRGYRIELGEIESALRQHAAIQEAVVVVHQESPNDKRLVAYVKEQQQPQPTTANLRLFLKKMLPEYMLPATFVWIEAFPNTPSGKIDRKALSALHWAPTDSEHTFVAPSTDMEKQLAPLWERILSVSPIGVHESFFELGGHSLLATRLVSQMREMLHLDIPLQVLFQAPTIAALARWVDLMREEGETALADLTLSFDIANRPVLDPAIRPQAALRVHSVEHARCLFLTGGTGFVGAFLLHELLHQTDAELFCLVRTKDEAAGQKRLQQNLADYGLWDEECSHRIIAVPGDLALPRFGLSQAAYEHLANTVEVIYHNGAVVNFMYPYTLLEAANVLGTQEVLRLACESTVKPVHYVSTISTFSLAEYRSGDILHEHDQPRQSPQSAQGYALSKWVAEQLVMDAKERGLPVSIYRPGLVTGHSQSGIGQINDFMWQVIRLGISMEAFPETNIFLRMTPVDYVVKALVHISRRDKALGKHFHLINGHSIPMKSLISWMHAFGYQASLIPFDQWSARVLECAEQLTDKTAEVLAPFVADTQSDAQLPEVTFGTANTEEFLQGTAIACPPIDSQLLTAYFTYFIENGHINPPIGIMPFTMN